MYIIKTDLFEEENLKSCKSCIKILPTFFAYYLLKIAKENLSKNLLLERYSKIKDCKE